MNIQRDRRHLSGSNFVDETFANLDLRNAVAQNGEWLRCKFINCKLDQATFANATFVNCVFESCEMRQTIMVSRIYSCTFRFCQMDQASFNGADIQDSRFDKCRAEYSQWSAATLVRTAVDCELHGARLDINRSDRVDWTGSNLWGAVVPISCATFVGNRFDKRQMHLFLALLCKSTGNDNDREDVRSLVDERFQRLLDRLVIDAEIDGDARPEGDHEGGTVSGELVNQASEVGAGSDSLTRILAG